MAKSLSLSSWLEPNEIKDIKIALINEFGKKDMKKIKENEADYLANILSPFIDIGYRENELIECAEFAL